MKSNQKEMGSLEFILVTRTDRQQGVVYPSLDLMPEDVALPLNSQLTLRKSHSLFLKSWFPYELNKSKPILSNLQG